LSRLRRRDIEEQFFDVAQAQLKAQVPAHGATDHARSKTVTVIQGFGFLHRAILTRPIQKPDNISFATPDAAMLTSTAINFDMVINRWQGNELSGS
jgi:hypothetical protein